jgi:hypothetical protein
VQRRYEAINGFRPARELVQRWTSGGHLTITTPGWTEGTAR